MYKMKADGVVFYDPSSDDMSLHVLSPKASFELNKAGSLTFTMLPGNVLYHDLRKMKTVITLEQDDEIIFCGRVLETATDMYNQKEVYCEGELAYLLDSLVRPYEFDGTASDLFRRLVTGHNQQVEEYKRFQVGKITAVKSDDKSKTEGDAYTDTLSEIKSMLLDEFNGYLRVRRENGVRYLDYVDEFEQTCSQSIDFGVNLLDIENKINAQELCTVLVPLGKYKSGSNVTIKDVNGGRDYIEDADGIAAYGRIVKTQSWGDVGEPAELLQRAREYMQKMKAETTITATALDLRACGADVDGIHLGDTVHLHSIPHGLDRDEICTNIDLDIEKPEKSEYTFGLPMETLTQSYANSTKSFSSAIGSQHKWLTETDDALNITVEAVNLIGHRTTVIEGDFNAMKGEIALKASQDSVDILGERVDKAELRISSAEAAIELTAEQTDKQEQRLTTAETRIDGAEAEIALKASQTTVDELGEKVTSAEVRIDGMDSTITAQAKKINLKADKTEIEGMLTVNDSAAIAQALSAQDVFCNSLSANSSVWAEVVNTGDLVTSTLKFDGYFSEWKSKSVVTNVTCTVETATTPPFYNTSGTMISPGIPYVKNVTITPTKETIRYLARKSTTEG